MTKKGFRNVSLLEETHERLTEVSNILGLTRPDSVKALVKDFLFHYKEPQWRERVLASFEKEKCSHCNGSGRIKTSEIMSDEAVSSMICQVCEGTGLV